MIRIGIIGSGLIAHEHAKSLQLVGEKMSLVAAADIDPTRLASFCSTYGIKKQYSTANDLIADPEIDLIAITTPPCAHEGAAVAALEAGKYVLCEKPIAHTIESAAAILRADRANPGRLSVSHQLRYSPAFQKLHWMVKDGALGTPIKGIVERHGSLPSSSSAASWWGAWATAGGGVLLTQMIHELDLMIFLLGKPIEVKATMDRRFTQIESEDFVDGEILFEGGIRVTCTGTVNSGGSAGRFRVEGTEGSIELGGPLRLKNALENKKWAGLVNKKFPNMSLSFVRRVIGALLRKGGSAPTELPSHALLYLDIENAIKNQQALPIGASEAMVSFEVVMAMYESAISGEAVTLPLSPDSGIYKGVTTTIFENRKCATCTPDPVFIPTRGDPPPSSWVRDLVVTGLAHVGASTETVKALLRRPQPVHGGARTRRMPWPRRRNLGREEQRAVDSLFRRERLFGGAIVYAGREELLYCEEFAAFLGGGYADAVNSGSNAIYVALKALDLAPGSEVIVPPITDSGSVMPVIVANCIPVPADSMPNSLNTGIDQISKVVTEKTRAILIAHIAGHPVDMDPILELANRLGIPVIEDCAQAHGTTYKGRMAGTLGSIGAFSTMFGKQHCTGGQGGVVFTKDPSLFAKVRQYADRGKPFGVLGAQSNVVASLNFSADELSCAIGRVQMRKLAESIQGRRRFVQWVERGLAMCKGARVIGDPPNGESSYNFLMLALDPSLLSCDSAAFAIALEREGVTGGYGGSAYAGYAVYPTEQSWHLQAEELKGEAFPWRLAGTPPVRYELTNAHEANRYIVRIELHEKLREREAKDLAAAIQKLVAYFSK